METVRPAYLRLFCPARTPTAQTHPPARILQARMQYPHFNRMLREWLHPLMRQGEQSRFSGVLYYLAGVFAVRTVAR